MDVKYGMELYRLVQHDQLWFNCLSLSFSVSLSHRAPPSLTRPVYSNKYSYTHTNDRIILTLKSTETNYAMIGSATARAIGVGFLIPSLWEVQVTVAAAAFVVAAYFFFSSFRQLPAAPLPDTLHHQVTDFLHIQFLCSLFFFLWHTHHSTFIIITSLHGEYIVRYLLLII